MLHHVSTHTIHTVLVDNVVDPRAHASDDILVFSVEIHKHNIHVAQRALLDISLCARQHSIHVFLHLREAHLVAVVCDEAEGVKLCRLVERCAYH